jgi:broad specificity phosphatase PhoE
MTTKSLGTTGLLASGAALGALIMFVMQQQQRRRTREDERQHDQNPKKEQPNTIHHNHCQQCHQDSKHRRERVPPLIILVRHGESEGNADNTLYRTKPDNLVELTRKGIEQAQQAGKRIEGIFKKADRKNRGKQPAIKRVHLVVSPFERTRQTAAAMRPWFEHRIVRTDIQPRIREQEFGNVQGEDFQDFRDEQKKVGRFWYRFATGESGADVYDRVKSWWYTSVLNVNERYGYEPVDALVIVTHGLTMRFALMQLFGWSPTTFHSVWNAGNCDAYVLQKDLTKPGMSPYVLDPQNGDMPKSSIDLQIDFASQPGCRQVYKLEDYLRLPPPRTMQLDLVKEKLEEQYPEIDKDDIQKVVFMPFIDGAIVQKRTKGGRRLLKEPRHRAPDVPIAPPRIMESFADPEECWQY